MIKESTVKKGARMEEAVFAYLEERGMRIVEKNFRSRQGEIDAIGYHGGCLVFVEVKYRKDEKSGLPEQAVTALKQKKICKTADYYRYLHRIPDDSPIRYDVAAVLGNQVRWYQGAFCHMY